MSYHIGRTNAYGVHFSAFNRQWTNPPAPFNPEFDPQAKYRSAQVSASMARDGFHAKHSRAECAAEWQRRYDLLTKEGIIP